MTRTLKVDLFTDIVCPWCLVGSVRLDQAIARLPADIAVEVENHPFLLDPNTPPEGTNVPEMLRTKYGRDPQQIWGRLRDEARASGIDLDPARQPMSYRTDAAHTLIAHAKPNGTQHALANALADAHFLEIRKIDDPEVLADIATGFGFDRAEALALVTDPAELARTRQRALAAAQQGISGVPFFVFEGKYGMSGCQPDALFDRAFALAMSGEEGAGAA